MSLFRFTVVDSFLVTEDIAEDVRLPGRQERLGGVGEGGEVAAVAVRLLGQLDDLAEQATHRVLTTIDGYGDTGPVPFADLRESCRHLLEAMVTQLSEAAAPDLSVPQRVGRRRAEQGLPLATALNASRAGFRFVWECVTTEVGRRGALDQESLVRVATRVWELADRYAEELASGYRDVQDQRMIQRDQERSALLEAVLTGDLGQTTIWEAAALLSLPYQGSLVVVAAEVPETARQALPKLENQLRVRSIASVWRLLPDVHVGVVALRSATALGELLDMLRSAARGRVGVSPLFTRLDRTTSALSLARIALRSSPPGTARVNVFDEAPLPLLVVSAPATAYQITEAVLGSLLDRPAEEQTVLLDTLEAWFAAGGSAAQAATQLYCHPNTVRHRIRRVEHHTGRSLDNPRQAAELYVALEALRRLPEQQARTPGAPADGAGHSAGPQPTS